MTRPGFFTALTILLAFSPLAHAENIAIHGSTTVCGIVLTPHKADIEHISGQTLDIVCNGSGRGLADLVAGKAEIAAISAPLETEVAASNAKAPGSLDPTKLVGVQIGEARAAFVVHASNPVTVLTLAQIADILSGKTTKWSEVGGADQPIVVVAAGRGDGVRSVVEARLLGGSSLPAQTKEVPNAPQVAQVTSQLPNAFGVLASHAVRAGVIAVKTDQSVGQPLVLITIGPASPAATRVIEAAKTILTQ
jgi:phosphate transport system substrate-binding protein